MKRSDIVLVAALSSPADAALYTAATRFVVFGQLFVQSVQQALSPQLSALFARGDHPAASSIFRAATLWSLIVAWPLYLVTAGFASPLMSVFGGGYERSSDVVVILSLTMLLATLCGSVDSVLLMAGRSWLSLANNTVALALNIGLNVVLIPRYGIRGAAVAWSVAIVVRNVLPLLQVRRQLGLWPLTRSTGAVALWALACFGLVDLLVGRTALPLAGELVVLALATLAYLCRHLVSSHPAGAECVPLSATTQATALGRAGRELVECRRACDSALRHGEGTSRGWSRARSRSQEYPWSSSPHVGFLPRPREGCRRAGGRRGTSSATPHECSGWSGPRR